MEHQEWDDLGAKIQDIINSAVNEQDYRKLSRNINQTVNKAIDSGSEALKGVLNGAFGGSQPQDYRTNENPEHNARAYETHKDHGYQQPPFGRSQGIPPRMQKQSGYGLSMPGLYRKTGGERAKGILMTVFGGVFTAGFGVAFLVAEIAAAAGAAVTMSTAVTLGAFTAAGVVLLKEGCSRIGRVGRFNKYIRALGQRTYCNFDQLARIAGKPVKYVKKDIKKMIGKGWFLEGHVDQQQTCLITSDETYQQYIQTQQALEERAASARKEEEKKASAGAVSAQVQEVLDRGNQFIDKIHRSNDAIPGEEISAKISRMELIVRKIFERVQEHPEVIPDLKRLMDYYLPTTVKLLDAYEDMDSQPVQGENIQNSKFEIEKTIDTLNTAFEKLLDSIFEDTAMDVSSDISVLHTVLAQEGLTEDEFTKMRKKDAL